MSEILSALKDVTKLADNVVTSDDERNKAVNERMKLDMSSDNYIAKAVRPILSFMFAAMFCWVLLTGLHSGELSHRDALIAATALVTTVTNFYFVGRTRSKIAEINAKANIEIERRKTKAAIRAEKRLNRKK